MPRSHEFVRSLGVIIISPEPNIARLNDTVRSIKNAFGDDASMVCCAGSCTKKAQMDELRLVCPAYKGGDTVTSLINEGFRRIKGDGWRLVVMEGARIPRGLDRRYETWIRCDRDVLFPIVVSYDLEGRPIKVLGNFEECTLNGVMIHSSLFDEVGEFSDNPIPVSKSFWAMGAMEKGAVFKAVLGVKII